MKIGIDRYDVLSRCVLEACSQCGRFSEVPLELNACEASVMIVEVRNHLPRTIV